VAQVVEDLLSKHKPEYQQMQKQKLDKNHQKITNTKT
jgi:hypothetical protein